MNSATPAELVQDVPLEASASSYLLQLNLFKRRTRRLVRSKTEMKLASSQRDSSEAAYV